MPGTGLGIGSEGFDPCGGENHLQFGIETLCYCSSNTIPKWWESGGSDGQPGICNPGTNETEKASSRNNDTDTVQ